MKHPTLILAGALLLAAGLAARAEVQITVGHVSNQDGLAAFAFTNVPPPAVGDAAEKAQFVVVDGEPDSNGGGLDKLNDGRSPTAEDQPEENFFFNEGTPGGRIRVDLPATISIRQINTYSWHPNTRGPQVYQVYGSDGTATNFFNAPKMGADPTASGWTLIAKVDTRAKNSEDNGGQYGVSISDTDGVIGKYRYLLFDIQRTENDDPFGNTFYSEIDIIDANAPASVPAGGVIATPSTDDAHYVFQTTNGNCTITINTAAATDLSDWARNKLAPVMAAWYPQIVAMLPSPGFTAPDHFSLTIKPTDGVAVTSGNRVTANSDWLRKELDREAVGSLVHEMVHVVQHIRGDGPGWLIEGTADYVRWFKYEPQSHGADVVWMRHLRHFTPRYDASYRVTANFLDYVSRKYDPDIVAKLNAAMRERRYDPDLWKQYTGKTVQELGDEWKAQLEAQLTAPAPDGTAPKAGN